VIDAFSCAAGEGSVAQRVEGLGQLLEEDPPVAGVVGDVGVEVLRDPDRVEPPAEDLDVLGLLEGELREVHLVLEPALGGHRPHERLDVLGHRLLAGDEGGQQEARRPPAPAPVSRSQSSASWEKSMSLGFQNLSWPCTNSFMGR
jgi:hypothetical protein